MHSQDVDHAAAPIEIKAGQTRFGKDILIKHRKNSQMYYIEVGGRNAEHPILEGHFTSIGIAQVAIGRYHNEVERLPPPAVREIEKVLNSKTVKELREMITVVKDGTISKVAASEPQFAETNLE